MWYDTAINECWLVGGLALLMGEQECKIRFFFDFLYFFLLFLLRVAEEISIWHFNKSLSKAKKLIRLRMTLCNDDVDEGVLDRIEERKWNAMQKSRNQIMLTTLMVLTYLLPSSLSFFSFKTSNWRVGGKICIDTLIEKVFWYLRWIWISLQFN
jgi:hypothetical protein